MATGKKSRRSGIHDLLRDVAEFEARPESAGYGLRLDLAEIILRQLDGKRWTQQKLAESAGMKSSFITRITHAAQNCTFDVAGRLLFALGVTVRLSEMPASPSEENLVASLGEVYGNTETISESEVYEPGANILASSDAA